MRHQLLRSVRVMLGEANDRRMVNVLRGSRYNSPVSPLPVSLITLSPDSRFPALITVDNEMPLNENRSDTKQESTGNKGGERGRNRSGSTDAPETNYGGKHAREIDQRGAVFVTSWKDKRAYTTPDSDSAR